MHPTDRRTTINQRSFLRHPHAEGPGVQSSWFRTAVCATPDLRYAKVYISVWTDKSKTSVKTQTPAAFAPPLGTTCSCAISPSV